MMLEEPEQKGRSWYTMGDMVLIEKRGCETLIKTPGNQPLVNFQLIFQNEKKTDHKLQI